MVDIVSGHKIKYAVRLAILNNWSHIFLLLNYLVDIYTYQYYLTMVKRNLQLMHSFSPHPPQPQLSCSGSQERIPPSLVTDWSRCLVQPRSTTWPGLPLPSSNSCRKHFKPCALSKSKFWTHLRTRAIGERQVCYPWMHSDKNANWSCWLEQQKSRFIFAVLWHGQRETFPCIGRTRMPNDVFGWKGKNCC